jgi:hypothetical protein
MKQSTPKKDQCLRTVQIHRQKKKKIQKDQCLRTVQIHKKASRKINDVWEQFKSTRKHPVKDQSCLRTVQIHKKRSRKINHMWEQFKSTRKDPERWTSENSRLNPNWSTYYQITRFCVVQNTRSVKSCIDIWMWWIESLTCAEIYKAAEVGIKGLL